MNMFLGLSNVLLIVVIFFNSLNSFAGEKVFDEKNTVENTIYDVGYKKVGNQKLCLDIYYPSTTNDKSLPTVIYTHGGGWAAGNKNKATTDKYVSLVTKKLLNKGFCVVSVQYRLSKKNNDVTIRDCIIDCKDAVRYLIKNSVKYNLDTNNIFTFGDSAGGHLAQMLLLTPSDSFMGDDSLKDVNMNIKACVSWYGPCDFENIELFKTDDPTKKPDRFGERIVGKKLNVDKCERVRLFKEVSPINYISSDMNPLLMIQGDADVTIPVAHAYYMKNKADSVAAHVETMIIKNAGHNWRQVGREIEPSIGIIIDKTIQFFEQNL